MMIYGRDAEIIEWVGQGLNITFPPNSRAIGLARNGKIIAGVVYHDFRYERHIELSIYTTTPRWATKEAMYYFYAYPFEQLGCARVTAVTSSTNKHTQQFLERMGYTKEGVLRDAYPDGDAIVYGLLKDECRYLEYGQKEQRTRSA